jgi:hypothetical protein
MLRVSGQRVTANTTTCATTALLLQKMWGGGF